MGLELQQMESTEQRDDIIKFLQFDENLYQKENKDEMKELKRTAFGYHNSCFHVLKLYHEMGLKHSSKIALEQSRNYSLKKIKAFCFNEDFRRSDEASNGPVLTEIRLQLQNDPILRAFGNNDYGWNIILSMIALGELQEAFNFIIHWMSFYSGRHETGFRSHFEHFLKWEQKQYVEQNPSDFYDLPEDMSYQDPEKMKRLWEGSSSPNSLLTIYFGLVLIKANVLHETEEYLVKHDEFTAFMMGTHPRLGENSHVKQLKPMSPIIQRIAHYVGVNKAKPTFLKAKNGRNVLKNNYDQVEKYLKKICQISVHGLGALTGHLSVSVPRTGFDEERCAAYLAGTFATPVFVGLENEDKILKIAQKKFGELGINPIWNVDKIE